MNVLNYFLIFVVAFAVVDVNGFPAKNKQGKCLKFASKYSLCTTCAYEKYHVFPHVNLSDES